MPNTNSEILLGPLLIVIDPSGLVIFCHTAAPPVAPIKSSPSKPFDELHKPTALVDTTPAPKRDNVNVPARSTLVSRLTVTVLPAAVVPILTPPCIIMSDAMGVAAPVSPSRDAKPPTAITSKL